MKAFEFVSLFALSICNQALQAGPLDTWSFSNPLPTGSRLSSVTYGNGQFVAVGHTSVHFEALIVTSSDTTNWIPRLVIPRSANGLSIQISDIAYGDGVFVAVGGIYGEHILGSAIFTSLDGVTWVPHLFPGSGYSGLQGIAYGNRQFVAVSGSRSVTSVNGTDWVFHDLQDVGGGRSIAYGNGIFVAVGPPVTRGGPSRIRTSVDGANWIQRESGTTIALRGIAYGKRQFVAVGGDATGDGTTYRNTILTSADGVNWVQRKSGVDGLIVFDVAFGNGQFVAVGGDIILTSTDGINWTRRQSSAPGDYLTTVMYGGGHFVAVGDQGTILKSGGIISVALTRSTGAGWVSLSLEGPAGPDYTIQTSTDLISWQDVTRIPATPSTQTILFALPADSERLFYRAYSR